ncbi:hypothetical protein [uncultured Dysosmobacter sp.]|uniref:hypothetical protein n=1 Tax=uncultured Dysosmobacter sp. TaxID=2591384 RepID=UPI002627C9CD|nr:hypothetical protein [uncultured Dysosmobacter sp.]
MPWIITNDIFFIRSDKRGCASPVSDRRKAKVFSERFNAEEFLRSLPKKMKNLGYRIEPVEITAPKPLVVTEETEQEEDNMMENGKESDAEELLDANYYLTEIAAFCVFIKRIRNERNRLEEEQVQAEMEIEDLLHAAEFNDLPCEQGYELYQKLHEARVRRRSYKNAVAWIDYIMEAKPEEFLRNDPSSRIMGTKYRQYRARALPELFHQSTES